MSEYMDMTTAAKWCPGRPHASAVWRWARRGLLPRGGGDRVHLRYVRVGAKLYTREEWLVVFFTACADGDKDHFRQSSPQQKERVLA